MPSRAAQDSTKSFQRALLLRKAGRDLRPSASSPDHVQTYYHASLAITVAAWDAYLNGIVLEFFSTVANPIDVPFHSLHTVARTFGEQALYRFNTPNFENSRSLIVTCTGYDPYSDWGWKPRQLGPLQVRDLLNQILQVRHSFAHGFSVPAYPWTQSSAGRVRLTSAGVATAEALLKYLITATDRGLRAHIWTAFNLAVRW